MYNELRKYFAHRFEFSNNDFEIIESFFISKKIRKGEFLQHAGDVTKYVAFVEKGCLRMYVIDHKSKEHIVQFAPETWWLNDSSSLINKTPSKYYIDAIEDSEVLLLAPAGHQKLADNFPGYLAAYQAGVQKHLAAKNERIAASLKSSAEERYLIFLQTYPTIALRVPQHMIASYLGISPETLSRVRHRIAKKQINHAFEL